LLYRAYTCTKVTAQAFNYARASCLLDVPPPAGRRTRLSQHCVSALRCRDKKIDWLYFTSFECMVTKIICI